VQVYAGVLILSMRCTLTPVQTGGLEKDNYLVLFFLVRRLRTFAAILRFGVLFPRFRVLVFGLLDLPDRALRERLEVPRRRKARSAVDDNGDLRPWRKAQTGALRSGSAAAEYSGMRARASTLPAGLAAA
jgi:hypothetical protein